MGHFGMKHIQFTALLLFTAALLMAEKPKSTLSLMPMSADQIAVYQAVLASYSNGSNSSSVNLSDTTVVLDVSDLGGNGCLEGITLKDTEQAKSITHKLPPEGLPTKFRLVDPKKQLKIIRKNDPDRTISAGKPVRDAVETAFGTGILTLSEVVFDQGHENAVLSFSFYCGQLCAHGETIVLHKENGQWKRSNRTCRGWISYTRQRPHSF